MPLVNQSFSSNVYELNPVGPGDNYTATTFIDHLVAWFTANTGGWTISASGTNYVELKPPAGAINPNDRFLIWGGTTIDASALALGTNSSASYVYGCLAPNAGTTGPDALPSAGNPYTGVNSTKMAILNTTITSLDSLQVFQSDDVLRIYTRADASGTGVGLCQVGRWFNPVGTTDQLPGLAGHGDSFASNWSQVAIGLQSPEWSSDSGPNSGDTACFVQETAGDVPFTQCFRSNGWIANGYKKANLMDANLFQIELHRTTTDPGNSTVFIGWPLFAMGGPAEAHGTLIADSGGDLGYAQSFDENATDFSTWYLINEAIDNTV